MTKRFARQQLLRSITPAAPAASKIVVVVGLDDDNYVNVAALLVELIYI